MELGELLGRGRTAEIYAWGEDQVIKLFYDWVTPETMEKEAEVHALVQQSKFRVPRLGELVEVNGRYGLIFERVTGESLMQKLVKQPWRVVIIARQLAQLHVAMHQRKGTGLAPWKKHLEKQVRGTESLSQRKKWLAIQTLKELQEGQALCHGDFHPDNVLIPEEEVEPMIIDWVTAMQGNPLADVARTAVIFKTAELPYDQPLFKRWLLRGGRWVLLKMYLWEYSKQSQAPVTKEEILAWEIPVAVARLNEGLPEEEQGRLLKLIDKLLSAKYEMRLNDQ